ncbi:MAG: hypothetical protein KKD77_20115 [Gammaproteobacteria bacterium]|nr:hypothetical protein [Gammaproteobacteria bacterium]
MVKQKMKIINVMKKLLLLILVACSAVGVHAQRIMDLPATALPMSTDLLVIDQTDATRSITLTSFFGGVPVTINGVWNINAALDVTAARNIIVDDTLFFADDSIYMVDNVDTLKLVVDDAVTLALTPTVAAVTGSVTVSGALTALGIITGLTQVTLDDASTVVLTAADCDNAVRFNNDADAIDYTLPGAAAGLVIMFYDIGGGVITIDPVDGTDTIYLNGTSVGAGDAIDSQAQVGDFICLMAIDDTRWVTVGRSGVWVDGGTD